MKTKAREAKPLRFGEVFESDGVISLIFEALAKFILGWWHRLPSLCKCLLKVDAH
jgi:hypothetical protein